MTGFALIKLMSIMTLVSLDTEELINAFPIRNPRRIKLKNIEDVE